MDRAGIEAGRERVRERVIVPLARLGLRKRRGQTAADLAAVLEELCARLAYLSEGGCETLRETVLRLAGGERRNLWPEAATILNVAAQIEPPPDTVSPLVRSWLGSAAGRRAWARGPEHALALRRYLKRYGPPQADAAAAVIAADAADMRARVEAALRRLSADPQDGRAREIAGNWNRAVREVGQMVGAHAEDVRAAEVGGMEVGP